MSEAEVSQFLCVLIKMGEALQNSGAEVFRVEDTLNRIAAAYGAEEVNIFVITSSIVVTLTMPGLPPQTQTRRLRKSTGNDLLELEQLNALSRRICAEKPPVEEFQQQLSTILAQPGEPRLHLAGSVLAAASFLRLMQDRAAESMGLFAATGVVLIAAVVVYLIYRTRNKRE